MVRAAEMPDVIRLAQAQHGSMPTPRVPPSFFKHFMRQPSPTGRSCSKPLLPGVLYCPRFSRSRLWNRSVFMVFVQDDQYLETGRDNLAQSSSVRIRPHSWRPECRWSPCANPHLPIMSLIWALILNYWPWLPPGLLWLQTKRFSPWNFHKLSGLTGIHIDPSSFKQMRR